MPSASVHLGYQYRMHRDIMFLCNALIYNFQLKSGRQCEMNPETTTATTTATTTTVTTSWIWQRVLCPSKVVVFLDTDTLGFHEERSPKGLVNSIEATVLLGLVNHLQQCGVADIGVLSPFRAQVTLLTKMMMTIEETTSSAGSVEV
jgi:hypothetical protein